MKAALAFVALAALLQDQPPTIQVDVNMQELIATVRDREGRLVKNLHANDFVLEEDGKRQDIVHFVQDSETPVSLGILIDQSGSMNARMGGPSRLQAAAGAVRVLIRSMKAQDEFILMSFSSGFTVRQDFTSDVGKIEQKLAQIPSSDGTNLFPAVESALKQLRKSKHRKRALIIVTDADVPGAPSDLQKILAGSEVLIYTFAIRDGSPSFGMMMPQIPGLPPGLGAAQAQQPILDILSTSSGGRSAMFQMQTELVIKEMIEFVQDIAAELRGQYTLGYYPARTDSLSNHVIRLKTNAPGLNIRIRRDVSELDTLLGR